MTEEADEAENGEVAQEVCTGLQLAEGEDGVLAKGCMFLWAVQHLASRQIERTRTGHKGKRALGALLQEYKTVMHARLKTDCELIMKPVSQIVHFFSSYVPSL